MFLTQGQDCGGRDGDLRMTCPDLSTPTIPSHQAWGEASKLCLGLGHSSHGGQGRLASQPGSPRDTTTETSKELSLLGS